MGIDFFRGIILLNFSGVADRNGITHAHGLDLVVGHKHAGNAQLGDQRPQFRAHFFPQQCIQCGKRLVKQDAGRFNDDRAGKCHTLLLSAGQLMRIPLGKIIQLYSMKRIFHLFVQVVRLARRPQTKSYIFKDSHVRPEGKVLKHKAKAALFGWKIDLLFRGEHTSIRKPDLTAVRRFQSGDHPQQGGLAAAGRPQQCGQTATLNDKAGRLDHLLCAKGFCKVNELDLHILHSHF